MEIILNNIKSVDIFKLRQQIKWVEIDFSSFSSLKGNKDILEQTFQQTKNELV